MNTTWRKLKLTGDMVISALGNRLYYSRVPIFERKSIQDVCRKFYCDGLFFLQNGELKYFDNNGSENFCGNALRSLPLVLNKANVSVTVNLGGINYLYHAYKRDDLFATRIRILQFKKLSDKQYSAYVGNRQLLTIVDSLDFDVRKEVEKLSKLFRNVTYVFVKIDDKDLASIRVFEENVGETMSCCSSASTVTRLMWKLFGEYAMKLKYRGGIFSTVFFPNVGGDNSLVEVSGECKVERKL